MQGIVYTQIESEVENEQYNTVGFVKFDELASLKIQLTKLRFLQYSTSH